MKKNSVGLTFALLVVMFAAASCATTYTASYSLSLSPMALRPFSTKIFPTDYYYDSNPFPLSLRRKNGGIYNEILL